MAFLSEKVLLDLLVNVSEIGFPVDSTTKESLMDTLGIF